MYKISALLMVLFLFTQCTKKEAALTKVEGLPPEGVVRKFVELSAASSEVEDRRVLRDLCSGELKRAFERLSDEEFRLTYVKAKIHIEDLKILSTKVESDTAKVRYSVKVQNDEGSDPTLEINEREVDLKQAQGGWFIETVRPVGSDKLAFTRGMLF